MINLFKNIGNFACKSFRCLLNSFVSQVYLKIIRDKTEDHSFTNFVIKNLLKKVFFTIWKNTFPVLKGLWSDYSLLILKNKTKLIHFKLPRSFQFLWPVFLSIVVYSTYIKLNELFTKRKRTFRLILRFNIILHCNSFNVNYENRI